MTILGVLEGQSTRKTLLGPIAAGKNLRPLGHAKDHHRPHEHPRLTQTTTKKNNGSYINLMILAQRHTSPWDIYQRWWQSCFVKVWVAIMKNEALAFGYVAYCDYIDAISPQNGNAPGYSHVLDIDNHHGGEPIFNGCKLLATLVVRACVYADAIMPIDGKVGLNKNLHLSIPIEKCSLPNQTLTPLIYFKPQAYDQTMDGIASVRTLAQSNRSGRYLKLKRYDQIDCGIKWGLKSSLKPEPEAQSSKGALKIVCQLGFGVTQQKWPNAKLRIYMQLGK